MLCYFGQENILRCWQNFTLGNVTKILQDSIFDEVVNGLQFGILLSYIIGHRLTKFHYYILLHIRNMCFKINLVNSNEIYVCDINSTKEAKFNTYILGIFEKIIQ